MKLEIENLSYKQQFYATLNERQRRHYAALEASQLGHGGILTVSRAFGIHRETISKALSELESGESLVSTRVRKVGAGRKKKGAG